MRSMKICTSCGKQKPLFDYYITDGSPRKNETCFYIDSLCKKCRNTRNYDARKPKIEQIRLLSDCFWFLNNSFASKMHPSRPVEAKRIYFKSRQHRQCPRCGNQTTVKGFGWCLRCRSEYYKCATRTEIENNRIAAFENADKHTELLLGCSKHGTCDVLAAHHEILSSDPEHLTTEFLVKLICNREYTPGSITKVGMRKGRIPDKA